MSTDSSMPISIDQETLQKMMEEIECDASVCNARCCTNILLVSDKEIARIRNYIGRNHIKPVNRHNIFSQEYIDRCPFLDDNTLLCKIYPVRPEICSYYSCNPYVKKKKPMMNYRDKKLVNMLLTFSPDAYCPNAPDLKEQNRLFKLGKARAYKKG